MGNEENNEEKNVVFVPKEFDPFFVKEKKLIIEVDPRKQGQPLITPVNASIQFNVPIPADPDKIMTVYWKKENPWCTVVQIAPGVTIQICYP